jgi:cytochrome bd-type quinol oxidase subunit 1
LMLDRTKATTIFTVEKFTDLQRIHFNWSTTVTHFVFVVLFIGFPSILESVTVIILNYKMIM